MKSNLAPTYSQPVGESYILWFKKSNQYVVVEHSLFGFIQFYLNSNTKPEFEQSLLPLEFDSEARDNIFTEIGLFLDECNVSRPVQVIPEVHFKSSHRTVSSFYQVNTKLIEVHYETEDIKNLIHPQLAHLSVAKKTGASDFVFDIYIDQDDMCLFKDESIIGSYPLKDYHLLQGKFAMLMLCAITNTEETDWLGTFHASTVEKNDKAVMLFGDSGSGKSTFTALLLSKHFNVIADDITPMKAKNNKVYKYPGGVSIKAGAFSLLESSIPNFKNLPLYYINPYKGHVKYVPFLDQTQMDFTRGFLCNQMVCIEYKKGASTKLEPLALHKALEIIIPESWLSPHQIHAKQFLDWIKDVKLYKLTYSNHEEAIGEFSKLFVE